MLDRFSWKWTCLRLDEEKRQRLAPSTPKPHMPNTDLERWIAEALLALDQANPDNATVINKVGFNKPDSFRGARFAACLRNRTGLIPWEWEKAVEMLVKYEGQLSRAGLRARP